MKTIKKVTLAFDESGQFEKKPVKYCIIGGCIVYDDSDNLVDKIKSQLYDFAISNKLKYKKLEHNANLPKKTYSGLFKATKNLIECNDVILGHRLYFLATKRTKSTVAQRNYFLFYREMLNTLFENLLLFNPKLHGKNIGTLEIIYPSRKVPLSYFSKEEQESIMALNFPLKRYKILPNGEVNKSKAYSVTRGENYKPKEGYEDFVINFSYETINSYILRIQRERQELGLGAVQHLKTTFAFEKNEPNPYFIISDLICNATLKNKLSKDERETNKKIHTFRFKKINDEYKSCVQHFFSKNYGEFYLRSLKFKRHHKTDNYITYHDWLNKYEEIMGKEIDKTGLVNLIEFGDKEVRKKRAGYYSEIKKVLLLPTGHSTFSELSLEFKVSLFDALVRCDNHLGHIEGALEISRKLKEIEKQIKNNRQLNNKYILTINRMSGIYTNSFNFKEAIKLLNPYVNERAKENQKSQFTKDVEIAKLFGSLGQNLAFLGRYQEAYEYLIGSFNTFPDDEKRSRGETMIHLGNLYLDSIIYNEPLSIKGKNIDSKVEFYKIIQQLVKNVSKEDTLKSAFNSTEEKQNPFLTRLIMKGAVVFEEPDIAKEIAGDFITYLGKQTEHPFEMICKDGAILHLLKGNSPEEALNLIGKSIGICEKRNSPIMLAIAINNLIDVYKHKRYPKEGTISALKFQSFQSYLIELIELVRKSPGYEHLNENLRDGIESLLKLTNEVKGYQFDISAFSDYQKFFRFNYH